jgi:hypothetical protein
MSTDEYTRVVDELVDGVEDPALLIEPARTRMRRLADLQRFEDAALVRDRWGSLSRAIHRGRVWRGFQDTGQIVVSGHGGTSVQISHGRLQLSWPTIEGHPLTLATIAEPSEHPPSMAAIDEAMLLWTWLSKDGSRIISVEGSLSLPASRIPGLGAGRSVGCLLSADRPS